MTIVDIYIYIQGTDVTIVAFSRMVQFALEAADKLAKEGIQAEVINLRSIRPLDVKTIADSVVKTSRLVTVEDGWHLYGVGAEVILATPETRNPILKVEQGDTDMTCDASVNMILLSSINEYM